MTKPEAASNRKSIWPPLVARLLLFVGVAGVYVVRLTRFLDQPKPIHPGWIWSTEGETLGSVVARSGVPLADVKCVVVLPGGGLKEKKTLAHLFKAMWDARSLLPPPGFVAWEFDEDNIEYSQTWWEGAYLTRFSAWQSEPMPSNSLVEVRSSKGGKRFENLPGKASTSHRLGTRELLERILDPKIAAQLEVHEFLEGRHDYSESSNGYDVLRIRVDDASAWVQRAVRIMTTPLAAGLGPEYRPVSAEPHMSLPPHAVVLGEYHPSYGPLADTGPLPQLGGGDSFWTFSVIAPDVVELSRWEPD